MIYKFLYLNRLFKFAINLSCYDLNLNVAKFKKALYKIALFFNYKFILILASFGITDIANQ
ncbi:hypothetical protein LBC_11410 [Campylobacter sp. 19-13652]|nr:hypothetical protein LBC_11410 [Campylobacter sp. 19-13652]